MEIVQCYCSGSIDGERKTKLKGSNSRNRLFTKKLKEYEGERMIK